MLALDHRIIGIIVCLSIIAISITTICIKYALRNKLKDKQKDN